MKIVIDTNIIFSAILTPNGKIGELLLNKPLEVHYISPSSLLEELSSHTKKILRLTGFDETELRQVVFYITRNIEFVNFKSINLDSWERSYHLLIEADHDDIPFLAMALQIDGFLWTGDKKLIKALQYNFNKIVTTNMLYSKYFE